MARPGRAHRPDHDGNEEGERERQNDIKEADKLNEEERMKLEAVYAEMHRTTLTVAEREFIEKIPDGQMSLEWLYHLRQDKTSNLFRKLEAAEDSYRGKPGEILDTEIDPKHVDFVLVTTGEVWNDLEMRERILHYEFNLLESGLNLRVTWKKAIDGDQNMDNDGTEVGHQGSLLNSRTNVKQVTDADGQDTGEQTTDDGDTDAVQEGALRFVLVTASYNRLLEQAETTRCRFPIKKPGSQYPEIKSLKGRKKKRDAIILPKDVDGHDIGSVITMTSLFTLEMKDCFYQLDDPDKFLPSSIRGRLVTSICELAGHPAVTDSKKAGKLILRRGFQKLVLQGYYTSAYIPHDSSIAELKAYEEAKVKLDKQQKAARRGSNNVTADTELAPNENPPVKPTGFRTSLWETWANVRTIRRPQPFREIRDYFGEKIGFYFVWLGFYTWYLKVAVVFGLVIIVAELIYGAQNNDIQQVCEGELSTKYFCPLVNGSTFTPIGGSRCKVYIALQTGFDSFFTWPAAVFGCLWAGVFMQHWKQHQNMVSLVWHTKDFEEEPPTRPEFKGEQLVNNPVTGLDELEYPEWKRQLKQGVSYGILGLMVIVIVSRTYFLVWLRMTAYEYFIRNEYATSKASQYAGYSTTICTLILMTLFDSVYKRLSNITTDWENHKTRAGYEGSKLLKLCMFVIVNTLFPVAYTLFLRGRIGITVNKDTQYDTCPHYGCFLEGTIQLATILIYRQFIEQIKETVRPMVKQWLKKRAYKKKFQNSNVANIDDIELPQWEADYYLPENKNSDLDYREIVIQFGILLLFFSVFPLGPFVCWFNNIFEIRFDAQNFLLKRRPISLRVTDIGLWNTILWIMTFVAVITNGFIIAVTSETVPRILWSYHGGGRLSGYFEATLKQLPATDFRKPLTGEYPPDGTCYKKDFDKFAEVIDIQSYELMFYRVICFLAFENFVGLLMWIISQCIADEPKYVKDFEERQKLRGNRALRTIRAKAYKDA